MSERKSFHVRSPQEVLQGIRFTGRLSYAVATTAFASLAVTCSALDDRCVAVSNLYGQYRITGVRVSMMLAQVTSAYLGVYFNSPTGSLPTTIGELADLPHFCQGSGAYGSPCPSLFIPAKDLRRYRQVEYFNTQLSASDAEFEYQFTVFSYAPFATLNHHILIEYVMEFEMPADPTSTLALNWRERQALARSKSKGIIWPEVPEMKTDDCSCVEGTVLVSPTADKKSPLVMLQQLRQMNAPPFASGNKAAVRK